MNNYQPISRLCINDSGDQTYTNNVSEQKPPKFMVGDEVIVKNTKGVIQYDKPVRISKVLDPMSGENYYYLDVTDTKSAFQESCLSKPESKPKNVKSNSPSSKKNNGLHQQGFSKGQNTPKSDWSIDELLNYHFPEPNWIVPDLIPVGLTIIGGRPKIGKSLMGLQIAVAKASGGYFLGKRLKQGRVLIIAFEDNPRRLKNRLCQMKAPSGIPLRFATLWPHISQKGLEDLRKEIQKDDIDLIIVDTISRWLGRLDQTDLALMSDTFGKLQELAMEFDIGIILIDHHRKPNVVEKDPIDDLKGSTGKSAPVDTAIGLYRQQGKHSVFFKLVGREVEEQET